MANQYVVVLTLQKQLTHIRSPITFNKVRIDLLIGNVE